MARLPGLRELGLWGTTGALEDVSMANPRRSQTSSPSNNHSYSPRHIHTEDTSPQLLPAPSFQPSHYTTSSVERRESKTYPSIFALEPRVITSHDAFEDCSWSAKRRRRDSDESVAGTDSSTPSLDGSCASFGSFGDQASPTLTPSTPQDVPHAPYFRDLSSEWLHHLSQQALDYDHHQASRPFFKDPFFHTSMLTSSIIPHHTLQANHRLPAFKTSSPGPVSPRTSLGSNQPSYRVEKPRVQRAKPKNLTGEAHCNEKYTQEENLFMIYLRANHGMAWKQIESLYNERFASPRPKRRVGGIESQFYRLNTRCPEMTADKLLIFGPRPGGEHDKEVHRFDENDNLVFNCKVRDCEKRSVVDRYAEQIAEARYEWIAEEDMREAVRLAALRRPHRLAWEAEKKANPALVELAKAWPAVTKPVAKDALAATTKKDEEMTDYSSSS